MDDRKATQMTKKQMTATAIAGVIGVSIMAIAAAVLLLDKRLDEALNDVYYDAD